MKRTIRNIMLLLASMGIKMLWIFPIKEKQLMFMSFRGQFSDSPKYIFEYLQGKNLGLEYVWVSNNNNQDIPADCRKISGSSVAFFYNLVRSKIIITNDFLNTYYPRRPGQIIINTWHGGSPLKTVGMVGGKTTEDDIDFFHRHNKIYSLFLSSSRFMTEEVFKKSFGYTGSIYETGMPRNAILLRNHDNLKKKVRNYYHIPKNCSIVLYAPTFRGTTNNGGFIPQHMQFDVERCLEALDKRFSKKFVLLFRAHHVCKNAIKGDNIISASEYPDMQELLCASDVMITDYSSCMGDEALMKKPVFLYCPDLDQYIRERGFYWDIYSLPFPVSRDEHEFIESIRSFDEIKYSDGVDKYLWKLGTFENKESDAKVGELVINFLKGNSVKQ